VFVALVLVAGLTTLVQAAPGEGNGWVALFSTGKDLSGWEKRMAMRSGSSKKDTIFMREHRKQVRLSNHG